MAEIKTFVSTMAMKKPVSATGVKRKTSAKRTIKKQDHNSSRSIIQVQNESKARLYQGTRSMIENEISNTARNTSRSTTFRRGVPEIKPTMKSAA